MIPSGFSFSAVNAGVKSPEYTSDDIGLVLCERDALVAGVFTKNRIKAAPVIIAQELVSRGRIRAVFANSGNANACTGDSGIHDAHSIMESVAGHLGLGKEEVIPLSTGVIGVKMPVERILRKIPLLVQGLTHDPEVFARSIMTTDTFPKIVRKQAGRATVLGIAKGAGMIAPDMATTLAVILTDAEMTKQSLDTIIKSAVEKTFNAITIDGDMSTNDCLIALSSCLIQEELSIVSKAIQETIQELALMIVRDGEGATKFVEIIVDGAQRDDDAKRIGLSVANSLLVKTALFGADPNWGRIMAAVGYSPVPVNETDISIMINGLLIVRSGQEAEGFQENDLHEKLKSKDIQIRISVGNGTGSFTVWTTDLSYAYVQINAEYRT
ncbi:MAG: bifunctional glutamate N-acetyltransferase/amino-acid acetyltransferase ArgJ [Desulfomonilia bacterium]